MPGRAEAFRGQGLVSDLLRFVTLASRYTETLLPRDHHLLASGKPHGSHTIFPISAGRACAPRLDRPGLRPRLLGIGLV